MTVMQEPSKRLGRCTHWQNLLTTKPGPAFVLLQEITHDLQQVTESGFLLPHLKVVSRP
jgi:hypothetical protein